MANYKLTCSHCGQEIVAYTHHLNMMLVAAFRKVVDAYESLHRPINLQQDVEVDHNQYGNFQKLQYFGLIKKADTGWVPTEHGLKFIYGEWAAPSHIITMAGKVIDDNHPAWAVKNLMPSWRFVKDIDEQSWKKRPEYAREKSSQTSLTDYIKKKTYETTANQ